MPRSRMMDYLRMRDGRNMYNARGGYSSRRMRRDRRDHAAMGDRNYEPDYRGYGDREYTTRMGDSASMQYDNARNRYDYEHGGQYDRNYNDYGDMNSMRDGHYPMREGKTYYPIEAMGTFNGYWGTPQEDYMRGRRYDYRGRDYGYDYGNVMLEDEDIEHWMEKLKKHVEEKDKQFFSKEHIKKRAEEMGIKFDKFSFEEFMVTALMMYTDYCKTLGTANMDIYLRLAKDWLCDEDVAVKYGEKLAAYYDNVVDPE